MKRSSFSIRTIPEGPADPTVDRSNSDRSKFNQDLRACDTRQLDSRAVTAIRGSPSERSFALYFLASYELDGYRAFTQSAGFNVMFNLS